MTWLGHELANSAVIAGTAQKTASTAGHYDGSAVIWLPDWVSGAPQRQHSYVFRLPCSRRRSLRCGYEQMASKLEVSIRIWQGRHSVWLCQWHFSHVRLLI